MKELEVHSSDEHYYCPPEWFIENQNRFDDFDRSGPRVFIGEYASNGNTLSNALAEAVYLTGVERNSDIVEMAAYAPLFAHVDHTNWTPANMIYFDKQRFVKTPNYYVQQMFSRNQGDVYLTNKVVSKHEDQVSSIAVSASRDNVAGEIIVKLVNYGDRDVEATIHITGAARLGKRVNACFCTVLWIGRLFLISLTILVAIHTLITIVVNLR